MSPDRWQLVSDLFAAAMEREPGRRNGYLQEACGGDPALRAEVESLIASDENAASFLNHPAGNLLSMPTQRPPAAPIPSQIARYHVLGVLGRGGMGTVYQAWDPVIGRLVAIKVINVGREDQELWLQNRRRFLREAQIAGRLQHKSIVMLFDMGHQEEQPYLVMEFVPGKSLATLMKDREILPLHVSMPMLRDVARALDFAHTCDVVHRDIKPGNLLLPDGGGVKVTDFGIAKFMSAASQTTAGIFVGTLGYIAPEIGRREVLDGRADQYSLGVLAYRLLTGRMPYECRTVAAFSQYMDGERPIAPSLVNPSLPERSNAALYRALAREPEDRYPSCHEFIWSLAAALKRS